MLTLDSAKKIALARLQQGVPEELVILDQFTLRKPYGYVFFYQAREYVETGDIMFMLAGNGPTVVLHDGSVHPLSTAYPPEESIAAFERERGLASGATP
jgi:hypothetical protein